MPPDRHGQAASHVPGVRRQKGSAGQRPECLLKAGSRMSASFAGWMARIGCCGGFRVGIEKGMNGGIL